MADLNDTRTKKRALLKRLRDGSLTLEQSLKDAGVTRGRFGRWLRSPQFRREVREALRPLDVVRRVESQVAANVAQIKLSAYVVERACGDTNAGKFKEATSEPPASRPKRGRKKSESASPESSELQIHPDLPADRQQELMDYIDERIGKAA